MSAVPHSHRDLLDAKGFAHLATLGPRGEPQSHPVWYDHEGDTVKFSTTRDRQKYRNVERDPRVSLSILDPANPYRYLELRGEVMKVEDDPRSEFIDELANKYMGVTEYPHKQPGDERVVIHVEPYHAATMG